MNEPTVRRHSSETSEWESAVRPPHPALRSYVREYFGGVERTAHPLVRRELPGDIAPIIINFGPPTREIDRRDVTRWTEYQSFATGAYDTYVLVGTPNAYCCLQINFTILGARVFLGRPLYDLANRMVALDDLFGSAAGRLAMELYDAGTWAARFDILDREILARVLRVKGVPPAVQWAWRRLMRAGGRVSIKTIVDEVGCSPRHLIAQFTHELGLTPKVMARVLRFGRAAELLKTADGLGLVHIANECGYYDQAHFSRDFREFAGVTPTELLASELPDHGGFAVDQAGPST